MNVKLDDRRPGLKPPRFGLATLMLAMTFLALLFAIVHYVGMLASVITIFFVLCVFAHIAGNALGTQLRRLGNLPEQEPHVSPDKRRRRFASTADFAPVTRLRERYSLGKRNIVITVMGAILGGALGGAGLLWLCGDKSNWLVAVLGFGASAVLSGIWSFAASSFVQVMLGAWSQAAKDVERHGASRR